MGHVYTVGMENTTLAQASDISLIFLRAATAITSRGSLLLVHRIFVGQRSTATSQMLGIQIGRKQSAYGTYTSAAPTGNAIGGTASAITGGTAGAAATSGVNASAEGAGTFTAHIRRTFNNLNGMEWIPTPEERLLILPDMAVVVRLMGAPSSTSGWSAGLTFEELN